MQGYCAYCRGAVCAFCGDCHTEGCIASYERCDREVLASISGLAVALGYTMRMRAEGLWLERGPSARLFASSSEGLREVEGWLETMLRWKGLDALGRVACPRLLGGLWQQVREAFGWA